MKGPSHRCAVVFVDNSGIDIILGIFPFARELLNNGTSVRLLCPTKLLKFLVLIIHCNVREPRLVLRARFCNLSTDEDDEFRLSKRNYSQNYVGPSQQAVNN